MLDQVQLGNAQLDHIAFINDVRNAVHSAVIVNVLHDTSIATWEQSFDANTKEHLIKGVFTSQAKTEACNAYLAKLVAQYMASRGALSVTWTKGTIERENFTNMAVINRINATEFDSNLPLFKIICSRLFGMDEMLIDFALGANVRERAESLVKYLALRYELSPSPEAAPLDYPDAVDMFEKLLKADVLGSPKFIGQLIENVQSFPEDRVELNQLDMFPRFVKHQAVISVDENDPDPSQTLRHVLVQGYDNVAVHLPNGDSFFFSTDETFSGHSWTTMLSMPEMKPITLTGEDDIIGELAAARKAFFDQNPRMAEVLSASQLDAPTLVEGLRESSLTLSPVQFDSEEDYLEALNKSIDGLTDQQKQDLFDKYSVLRTSRLSSEKPRLSGLEMYTGAESLGYSDEVVELAEKITTYFNHEEGNREKFSELNPALRPLLGDDKLTVEEVVDQAQKTGIEIKLPVGSPDVDLDALKDK